MSTSGPQSWFELRRLSRPNAFLLVLAVVFLLPLAIPRFGIDYTYFFIFIIVFFAWLMLKWESVQTLTDKSTYIETILGVGAVAAVYAEKIALNSRLGILDMVIIFAGLAVAFFGFKSFKLFWVPAAYGVVLLLGYQVENDIPNYVALQDWMAGLMAGAMNTIGISSTVSGHVVALNANSSSPVLLDVESDCTGIQGVLAFGLLASMALIDTKPKASRLVPLLILGFGGVFLVNILRLVVVFLAFDFLGVTVGNDVHVYAGYLLFVVWILVFWSIAFRYLSPKPPSLATPVVPSASRSPG